MARRIPDRFRHPYYVFNAALCLAFVVLRIKRLDPGQLGEPDPFGFARENQIYISLVMLLFVRVFSAPTFDAYMSHCFMFSRVAVLLCLWFMDRNYFVAFCAAWTLLYVVYPQPRYKHPSSVLVLNNVTFDQRISPANPAKTINVVWFHATWSPLCTQLAPVLATLAGEYQHVRLKFCKADLSRWPQLAERYGISMAASSRQLPTIICFKRGVEVARIPSLKDVAASANKWRRGFTAAQVARELRLKKLLEEAQRWEKNAQERYREEQAGAKSK